jgi:hypothetical protein
MTVQALNGLKKFKTVSFHRRDRAAGASLELTSTMTEKWGQLLALEVANGVLLLSDVV